MTVVPIPVTSMLPSRPHGLLAIATDKQTIFARCLAVLIWLGLPVAVSPHECGVIGSVSCMIKYVVQYSENA